MNTPSIPSRRLAPARASAAALALALTLALCTLLTPSSAQAQPVEAEAALARLAGRWMNAQDDTVLELKACADDALTLCVRLIRDSRSAGRASRAGQVLAQNLVLRTHGQWQGQFIGPEGERFPVTLAATAVDRFEFQVCPLPFACDRGAYQRQHP